MWMAGHYHDEDAFEAASAVNRFTVTGLMGAKGPHYMSVAASNHAVRRRQRLFNVGQFCDH